MHLALQLAPLHLWLSSCQCVFNSVGEAREPSGALHLQVRAPVVHEHLQQVAVARVVRILLPLLGEEQPAH